MCIGFDFDNPRRNADCGVRLGEGKVPFPRALSTLSTRSKLRYRSFQSAFFRLLFCNGFCLFLGVLGFSLQLRYRRKVVFREVRFMIAFGSVRVFRIRSAHSGFCHFFSLLLTDNLGISIPRFGVIISCAADIVCFVFYRLR